MTAWLINYHKWPSSLSLMFMPLSAPADIFLGCLYFEELWTRGTHHPGFPDFPGSQGPYTLTPGSHLPPSLSGSSSPAGHPSWLLAWLWSSWWHCVCVCVCARVLVLFLCAVRSVDSLPSSAFLLVSDNLSFNVLPPGLLHLQPSSRG